MKKPILLTILLALSTALLTANPFCANEKATREYFHKLCDYIAEQKQDVPVIFIGGYYMRDLVAGYKMFGEKRYLDTAIAYADRLLEKQSARGYWQTGYGRIYLADTGSALGLFIVLYDHVDKERKQKYFNAVRRYVDAVSYTHLTLPTNREV